MENENLQELEQELEQEFEQEEQEQQEPKIRIIPKRQGVFFYAKNEDDAGVLEVTVEELKDLISGRLMFNETLDGLIPYTETEERNAFFEKARQREERAGKIAAVKNQLDACDLKAQENADGYYTSTEWDKIRAVRVWLRERIKKLKNTDYVSAIPPALETLSLNAFINAPEALLEIPAVAFEEWTVGTTYQKGAVVFFNGVKWLCMTAVTAMAHQPPDMPDGAMLAVYKPHRDAGRYPWLYGEFVLKGYQRSENEVWYECIQADAGANVYSPSQVPAVWKKL